MDWREHWQERGDGGGGKERGRGWKRGNVGGCEEERCDGRRGKRVRGMGAGIGKSV